MRLERQLSSPARMVRVMRRLRSIAGADALGAAMARLVAHVRSVTMDGAGGSQYVAARVGTALGLAMRHGLRPASLRGELDGVIRAALETPTAAEAGVLAALHAVHHAGPASDGYLRGFAQHCTHV